MMLTLTDYKKEFQDRRGVHFNNAGMAPISRSVAERVSHALTQNQFEGSFVDAEWVPAIRNTRMNLARFLSAEESEVAFTLNCAQALSQVAMGFPMNAKDSVVTLDQEYASNFYPWKVAADRAGATLITVSSESNKQIDLEKLMASIKPGVKLVGVSWVQFQTGSRLDLKTLGEHCRSVGAFLIVDAIQGLGQMPFSFASLPVDMVVGGSHKWLCSLNGQGFLAIKKPLLQLLNPILVGSSNFNRFGSFAIPEATLEKSARKFEAGGMSYLPLFALDAAIKLASEVGVSEIEKEISRLSSQLRQGLQSIPSVQLVTPENQAGGITSFKMDMESEVKFLSRCREEKIMLVKRGEYVRISLHAFCNEEEVDLVLSLLRGIK